MNDEIGFVSAPADSETFNYQPSSQGDINTDTLPLLWEKPQSWVDYQQVNTNQNESSRQLTNLPAAFAEGSREASCLQDGTDYSVDLLADLLEEYKISSASTEPRLVEVSTPQPRYKQRSKHATKTESKPRASK